MDNVLQLHEFFVEGGNQERSHVLLHITEPSTPEEKNKGYFFAVAELNDTETRHIVRLQEIIDEIENSYYETPNHEDKNALEIVLEKINRNAYTLTAPEITLNCAVGVIRPPEVIFSFYGSPQMLLFYKNREELYQKMDLVTANQSDESDNRQLFGQIIQGKISPDDYLFVGTPHIVDYFNHDRLYKIITTRPARQSAEHLERVLGELKNELSFGGMVIHLNKGAAEHLSAKKERPAKEASPGGSLHNLFNTEQNTASILSSSMFPRMGDRLKNAFKSMSDSQTQRQTATPRPVPGPTAEITASHLRQHHAAKLAENKGQNNYPRIIGTILLKTGKFLIRMLAGLAWALYSFIVALGRLLMSLFFVITNYQNRRRNVWDNLKRAWHSRLENFYQLPLATKVLLIAAVAIAAVFAVSIAILRVEQNNAAAEARFQTAVNAIKNHTDAAESAVIYNDNLTALDELQTGRTLFAELDCKKHQSECQNVKTQIENLAGSVQKLKTTDAVLLTDFSSAALKKIIRIGGKILTYGPTSSVYIYDLLTKNTSSFTAAGDGFTAAAVPKENDYALFLFANKNILRYSPKDGATQKIDISYPKDNANIAGMVIYNRRLYTLDTANGEIYRHDSIKTGFGPGKEWLKNSLSELNKGVDLTIEGDIFVLENDGNIARFAGGARQDFAVQGLDPLLTGGNQIFSYVDLNYLYVLDASNKRLIILEKDGRLKQQITAPQFNNPTGVIVDEPAGTAYIIDGGKLYQIGLK